MKPAAFEYCRPDTLDEALELLHELGPDASVLAGGMSLGAMLNMRLARPAAVVDIKRIPGLDAASVAGEVRTGATLTQARALEHDTLMREVPLLALALPWVGHFRPAIAARCVARWRMPTPAQRCRSCSRRSTARSSCSLRAAPAACVRVSSSSTS